MRYLLELSERVDVKDHRCFCVDMNYFRTIFLAMQMLPKPIYPSIYHVLLKPAF